MWNGEIMITIPRGDPVNPWSLKGSSPTHNLYNGPGVKKILILHGPNLNLLGVREPAVYGHTTLADVNKLIRAEARRLKVSLRIYQRNGEGQLIDLIGKHRTWASGIVINPGAYTHYSYALRDAIAAVALPAVEVHLSDLREREAWRRKSVIAEVCAATVMGKGAGSYLEGLRRLAQA